MKFAFLQEHGLIIVGEDEDKDNIEERELVRENVYAYTPPKKALVSGEVASLLEKAGDGSLG